MVLESVLEILGELPGIAVTEVLGAGDGQGGAIVELVVGCHAFRMVLSPKMPTTQSDLLREPSPLELPHVYIAPSIPRRLAQKFQEQGIFYADTAGNIFISFPGLYIVRQVDSPPRVDLRPVRSKDALLNPSATRVALHLLANPELAKASLRQIANVSGVALRSAQLAMETLCAGQCLLDLGKGGYKVAAKERLFHKFVDGFNQKLRHKLYLGSFAPVVQNSGVAWDLTDCAACWGGDEGADRLTQMLHSQDRLVYVYKSHVAVTVKNKLRLDPQGSVKMYSACWTPEMESAAMVAPVFVIYADLLYAQDPRCDEVAEALFAAKIQDLLHE